MARNNDNNPRMPIYWELLGFSEEEAKVKAKARCRECSVRCVEYWMKKGFSLEEAKEKVREIQDNGKYLEGRVVTEEQKQKTSDRMKEYNTLDYWVKKYGEEIGREKYQELLQKQRENSKKMMKSRLEKDPDTYINGSIRRPEYWIRQGYTEEEAKLIVSKKQSRGIDFYIKKYGQEEGTKKWKERNEKWYQSFYESGKDLDLVNEKRKLNAHVGYYTKDVVEEADDLHFYLITLCDVGTKIIKYGLTKQEHITKRWSISLDYNIVLFKKMKAYDAIDLENEFHSLFKNTYFPSVIKTTECFVYNDDNLNEAVSILKKFNIIDLNEVNLND